MELERKVFKATRVETGAQGLITALVSVFNVVDRAGERVMPGAFKASLARQMPKGVWAHDWTQPIAKTLEAKETPEGLVIKGQFNLETQRGREAFSDLKFGSIDQFSFGYRVVKDSYAGDSKDIRQLDEVEIFEWSPVLIGMAQSTGLLSIKDASALSEEKTMSANQDELSEEMSKPIRPNFGGNPNGQYPATDKKSYAERFVESREYKDFLRSHSIGSESQSVTFENVSLKTLMTTVTGWVPESTRSGLVVPYPTRPIQITDIIPTLTTNQNSFVYMEHTGFSNTAVETGEGLAKPEAVLSLTERSSPVRKIPVHIPVTDEQLEDVPGIQDWIESQLAFMVRQRLDSQIINGGGTGVDLLGIIATPSVQTQAKGADPVPDAIAKAMTKVRVTGRAQPSAVLMHPNDWQEVQLLRTVDGIYIAGSPWNAGPETVWGLPVVQSDAVPENTAIVGDFTNFTRLIERKSLTIKVGYTGDNFTKNIRTVLAELRVAFVVLRPTAICLVTGI